MSERSSSERSCPAPRTHPIRDESDIPAARQAALALAGAIGLGRSAAYALATAVSELATNLVLHTTNGGTLRLAVVDAGGRAGIEVESRDAGPGIPDLALALRDGFSTGGGLGGGLPGARRLMDEFEITSRTGPDAGTRIVARKWKR